MALSTEERALIAQAAKDVVGMRYDEALAHIRARGFSPRTMRVNGRGVAVTADVRDDRVGLFIRDGNVEKAEIG